jgi:hypothetical protein
MGATAPGKWVTADFFVMKAQRSLSTPNYQTNGKY